MPWDGAEGTDRRLALALAQHINILYVDPPMSWRGHRVMPTARPGVQQYDSVAPGVFRLRVLGPPGVTRPGIRVVAHRLLERALDEVIVDLDILGTVLTDPILRFPPHIPGQKAFYVTDDWVAGAHLMGLTQRVVAHGEQRNARIAHTVLAVSPVLASVVRARTGVNVDILPNGCTIVDSPAKARIVDLPRPVAGLTGQMNERIDLSLLEAVVDRGVSLLLVGGRKDRDAAFASRFDALVSRPNVCWVREQPAATMPEYLASMDVGITPYADSAFNRASFPIKTLDYLAAGLPVVATPSPALEWLNTSLVIRAGHPSAFAEAVFLAAEARQRDSAEERKRFALTHSWSVRASQFLDHLSIGLERSRQCSPTHRAR